MSYTLTPAAQPPRGPEKPTSVHAEEALRPSRLHQAVDPGSRGQSRSKCAAGLPAASMPCSRGHIPADQIPSPQAHARCLETGGKGAPSLPRAPLPSTLACQHLHSFVHGFPMLVLQASLGQVDGEHAGHPHEPCYTSIDEFGCDARTGGGQGEERGRGRSRLGTGCSQEWAGAQTVGNPSPTGVQRPSSASLAQVWSRQDSRTHPGEASCCNPGSPWSWDLQGLLGGAQLCPHGPPPGHRSAPSFPGPSSGSSAGLEPRVQFSHKGTEGQAELSLHPDCDLSSLGLHSRRTHSRVAEDYGNRAWGGMPAIVHNKRTGTSHSEGFKSVSP